MDNAYSQSEANPARDRADLVHYCASANAVVYPISDPQY
jgi:hypothetical protein